MNWKNIRLIFLREVRDQLRDRRTLFMVAVLPLMLYPALGIGMLQMTLLFTEQPRTVVILGEKHLPQPQLLDGDRFVSNWFINPDDASKLKVITDGSANEPSGDSAADERQTRLIGQAKALRTRVDEHAAKKAELDQLEVELRNLLKAAPTNAELGIGAEAATPVGQTTSSKLTELTKKIGDLKAKLVVIDHDLSDLFAASQIQVLIVVPDGLKENIERVNHLIAEREMQSDGLMSYPRPTIVKNRADDKSVVAYSRVREVLDAWEQEILRQRLSSANLPQELPNPVGSLQMDLAAEEQLSANVWSKMFPALLVIMAVTGAFYPAVDVAAGEKERGTMETLLICPATRTEIVLGKFLTVMCFSVSTALLNLMSIGMTGNYMLSARGAGAGAMAKMGEVSLPSLPALAWLLALLIPLSALFSALCLALATFARSSKEGQYYLTPLLMVSIGLTVFCLSPAVEIYPVHQASWFYSVMPVVGIALLLKALLLNPGNTEALIFAGPVLVTSIGYSLLALWWAIEQFSSEGVLFREGERFEPALWFKHLLRDKEPTPSFTEAGFCFVMIMLAQFASMRAFGQSIAFVAPEQMGEAMMRLLVIQQIAIIACPALFMGLILTTSVRQTFRLRWPGWRFVVIAALLPFTLHPLSLELVASLSWFFPQLPEGAARLMKTMSDHGQPLWLILLSFAAAPAICEELAFRGFILTGFSRNGRTGLAIGISAVTFGVMHMIPQQVFNATLLGLVLGLIAARSGSLLPGVVFHFLFNSMAVVRERVGTALADGHMEELQQSAWRWFVSIEPSGLRYGWPTLLICGASSTLMLLWVARHSQVQTCSAASHPMFADKLAAVKTIVKPQA
ncbi:MAG: ABC transporter permease subunit [Planctomycetia bacterium]|nr:ABC transporter permease subunit [Planctomycetia bacterium]